MPLSYIISMEMCDTGNNMRLQWQQEFCLHSFYYSMSLLSSFLSSVEFIGIGLSWVEPDGEREYPVEIFTHLLNPSLIPDLRSDMRRAGSSHWYISPHKSACRPRHLGKSFSHVYVIRPRLPRSTSFLFSCDCPLENGLNCDLCPDYTIESHFFCFFPRAIIKVYAICKA